MNKSMKCIILIFAVIMIMVITGLGFCKGRNQEKITKEKKIERGNRTLWLIVVIVGMQFIGPILYFLLGKEDS